MAIVTGFAHGLQVVHIKEPIVVAFMRLDVIHHVSMTITYHASVKSMG
jgi:hypothetical protein